MRNFFTLLLSVVTLPLFAQEAMRVVRCDAVSNNATIQNIYVDEEDRKWVSNEEGLTQVLDLALGQKVAMEGDQMSLLQIPGGNANINFSKADLENALGVKLEGDNQITCARYHLRRKALWIGTSESGAFRLKVDGKPQLVKSYNSKNSKLKSDQINNIYVDPFGRTWIGTSDGVMVGKDDKWDLKERYFNFTKVRSDTSNRNWLLADDLLGYMTRKQVWTPVDLPEAALDGPIVDFTFDSKGYLWVATEVIARIDLNNEDYDIYGPAEYYTSQYATQLEAGLDGSVWVATEDKGLYLIEPASNMTVNALVEKALSCEGQGSDAALSVRVTGGIPPYNYEWEGGLSGEKPSGLGKGTYVVTVTDSRGNQKIATAEITDPNVIASAAMVEKASGLGQKDGQAKVEVSQGIEPFTYLWDNGERTETAIELDEGTHQVTVTDKNGCSTVAEVEMQRIIGALAGQIEQTREIVCQGGSSAALTVKAEGGKEPFSYAWSNGGSGDQISDLKAGSYTVTITDVLETQTTASFEVSEPEKLSASINIIAPATTDNEDGQAGVVIEGGTKPFKVQWSNGATTDTVMNLAPGMHQITVTDANSCITTAETEIKENILDLAATIEVTGEIKCYGGADAAFSVAVRGGKGPFKYEWDKQTISGSNGKGLVAGDYKLTVTDAVGQQVVQELSIVEPSELKVNGKVLSPASVNKADGELEVTVSGGTAPYQYQWSNDANEKRVRGLKAGSYNVTVTDANGCQREARLSVDENILPLTAEIEIKQEILCGGEATGALRVVPQGGKGPFTYKWNTGSTEEAINDLQKGFYFVNVYDAVGNEISVRTGLEQPDPITVKTNEVIPATTDQADGKASITVEGGVTPISFKWDNGEDKSVATKLAPGERTVSVTDANGCVVEHKVEVGEDVQPIVSSIEVSKPVTCRDDQDAALKVQLQGGKAPFSFAWAQEGLSGDQPTNLAAGDYQVTITDAIGQTSEANVTIDNPEALELSIINTFPSVENGASDGYAKAKVVGGVEPYTYAWNNGETTEAAVKLSTGPISVTVTDANACKVTNTGEIGVKQIEGLSMSDIEIGRRIQLEKVKFAADSDVLDSAYHEVLDELYNFMIFNPNVNIEIGGHTNNLPPDDYCDDLSRRRAQAAANYLLKQKGLPILRVFYKGYGKREPIVSNDTEEGRAKNQRIEVRVISIR